MSAACHGKTKPGPVHDVPVQKSLICRLTATFERCQDSLKTVPIRCCDLLELTLDFEARDLNSVIQQAVRSGI